MALVPLVATRRIGGALYVLIEESSAGAASILAPRFWRAFIEINERLVLVTVSSFSDRPVAEDAMMGFLALQMTGLRRVNRLRAEEEEDKIAADMAASFDLADAQGGLTLVHSESAALIPAPAPAAASAVISNGSDPVRAPVPRQRVASAGAGVPRGSAPARAPVAPQRPG